MLSLTCTVYYYVCTKYYFAWCMVKVVMAFGFPRLGQRYQAERPLEGTIIASQDDNDEGKRSSLEFLRDLLIDYAVETLDVNVVKFDFIDTQIASPSSNFDNQKADVERPLKAAQYRI